MRVTQNNYNLVFILGMNPAPIPCIDDDIIIQLDDDTLLCIDKYNDISVLDAEGNEIQLNSITINDVMAVRWYIHRQHLYLA